MRIPGVNAPATLGNSSAIVLLTPTGVRLVGAPNRRTGPSRPARRTADWNGWFAAFGMDSSAAYTPVPLIASRAHFCDTGYGVARTVALGARRTPRDRADGCLSRAPHALHGRPATGGVTTYAVDQSIAVSGSFDFLLHAVSLTCCRTCSRSISRGAISSSGAATGVGARASVFVFFSEHRRSRVLDTACQKSASPACSATCSRTCAGAIRSFITMGMWFAYVALEPYARLWPRVLVSWTRLLSGSVPRSARRTRPARGSGTRRHRLRAVDRNYAIALRLRARRGCPPLASYSQFVRALTPAPAFGRALLRGIGLRARRAASGCSSCSSLRLARGAPDAFALVEPACSHAVSGAGRPADRLEAGVARPRASWSSASCLSCSESAHATVAVAWTALVR